MIFVALVLITASCTKNPVEKVTHGTGYFTGAVSPSLGTWISYSLRPDVGYCTPEDLIDSESPEGSRENLLSLLVNDAFRIAGAFNAGSLLRIRSHANDYKAVLGIPPEKSIFQIGPQDINVTVAVKREFAQAPEKDRAATKELYDEVDRRALHFKVYRKTVGAKARALREVQNASLGNRLEDVIDGEGRSLQAGWLWRLALEKADHDPVKAIKYLSYRGVEPEFRIGYEDGHHVLNAIDPADPSNRIFSLPDSLSSEVSIPTSLEEEIIRSYKAVGANTSNIFNKSYHSYSSAYVGCLLASRGHDLQEIVRVTKSLALAYRDFTFRHQVCARAKKPRPPGMPYNSRDDAVALFAQLNRDSQNLAVKVSSLKNVLAWPEERFAKARAYVSQWLLDWVWTESLHERGARWGAKVCSR